jgi:hypothetical protein
MTNCDGGGSIGTRAVPFTTSFWQARREGVTDRAWHDP